MTKKMSYYKHIKHAVENDLLSDRSTPKLTYKECYQMFQEAKQEVFDDLKKEFGNTSIYDPRILRLMEKHLHPKSETKGKNKNNTFPPTKVRGF